MDYEKVKDQFGDWAPKFKDFIESAAFDDIFKFLKDESRQSKTICPASRDVFRTFRETPYKGLRSVFILQDPYPWVKNGKMVADGIPMSCSHTKVLQPSLELFYEGMEDDLGYKVPREPDLSYLSKQGVLLLNSSLTVEENKRNSHKGVWDPFMKFLVEDIINYYNSGICYVAFGKEAIPLSKMFIPFLHYGFEVEHPAAAAHREGKWKHDNIFSRINKVTFLNNNEKIKWTSGDIPEAPIMGTGEFTSKGIGGRRVKEA